MPVNAQSRRKAGNLKACLTVNGKAITATLIDIMHGLAVQDPDGKPAKTYRSVGVSVPALQTAQKRGFRWLLEDFRRLPATLRGRTETLWRRSQR
jgi:hypothetical protein